MNKETIRKKERKKNDFMRKENRWTIKMDAALKTDIERHEDGKGTFDKGNWEWKESSIKKEENVERRG